MERSASIYTFGPYAVDAASRRLTSGESEIPLNGKAFELLLIFLESGGAAVSRDALYDNLWPDGTVEDGNLSQNIYLLRRALDRDERRYVETIPRFGYRFCAPVRRIERSTRRRTRAAVRAASFAAALLLVTITGSQAARVAPPMPAAARESYALGEFHLHLRTPDELEYARSYFRQTAQRAPQEPAGYAGLASTYALLAEYYSDGSRAQQRYLNIARANRDAALARDPQDSDALAAAGFIAYRFDQDPRQARRVLDAALASNPDNAAAHHWHGVLLLTEGDIRGAVADLEAAHRLDPTSEIFIRWLARTYAYAGRADDALAMVSEALRIEPRDEASLLVRACAQEERGDLRGALHTLQWVARDPWEVQFVAPDEARILARLDRRRARTLTARIDRDVARRTVDPFEASLFYLTVGLHDRANALLRGTNPSLIMAGLEKNDPRYKALHRG